MEQPTKRRGGGRPKLADPANDVISFGGTNELRGQLEEGAKVVGTTLSTFLRELVTEVLPDYVARKRAEAAEAQRRAIEEAARQERAAAAAERAAQDAERRFSVLKTYAPQFIQKGLRASVAKEALTRHVNAAAYWGEPVAWALNRTLWEWPNLKRAERGTMTSGWLGSFSHWPAVQYVETVIKRIEFDAHHYKRAAQHGPSGYTATDHARQDGNWVSFEDWVVDYEQRVYGEIREKEIVVVAATGAQAAEARELAKRAGVSVADLLGAAIEHCPPYDAGLNDLEKQINATLEEIEREKREAAVAVDPVRAALEEAAA